MAYPTNYIKSIKGTDNVTYSVWDENALHDIDTTLSNSSTNPVQNKAIAAEFAAVYEAIASSGVTGVKGNAETSYRTGQVNLTPANIGAATSGHTHYYITTIGDQRSTGTTPNTYANQIIFQGLKGKATIGNPSNDSYSYLIGLRGWSDSSGGNAHEIAFNDTGVFLRKGATSTWGSWEKILTSGNITFSNLPTAYWANIALSSSSSISTSPTFSAMTAEYVKFRSGSTAKAQMNYDSTEDAIKFTFV